MKKRNLIILCMLLFLAFTGRIYAYETYKLGDQVTYNGTKYYVMEDSDENSNYLALLKAEALTPEEIEKYNGDIEKPESVVGLVNFYTKDGKEFTLDYNDTNVKVIVDNWANITFGNNLVTIDGYKARLLNDKDITNLKFEQKNDCRNNKDSICREITSTNEEYSSILNSSKSYWTMVKKYFTDRGDYIYEYDTDGLDVVARTFELLAIKPVVNVKKDILGSQKTYEIGDEVTYKNEKYYVLYDVKEEDNHVTLIKENLLTEYEINQALDNNSRGYISFYSNSDSCHTGVSSGCVNDYTKSNIKNIIDKWYEDTVKKSDQKKVGKYKVRLLTTDELIEKYGYETITGSINYLQYTEDTPEWIYSEPSGYWAMDTFEDNDSQIATINKIVYSTYVYGISGIRPVIYINKCGIGDKACQKLVCKEGTKEHIEKVIKYNSYLIGDVVSIKGEDYYVLEDSSEQKSTLTLLKEKPISEDIINKYTNNKYEDDYGSIPFYENETCKETDEYPFYIDTGCSTSYDKSLVKDVLEKWVSDTFDEDILEDIDGTKVRLLTTDELVDKYGFVVGKQGTDANAPTNQTASEDTPDFLLEVETWTTSVGEDGIYSLSNGSTNLNKPYDKAAITPIINVDKCAIDGGCYEEEEIVGCDPIDKEPESIVHVDNTLSMLSMVGFILGGALIIFGISLLGYNYMKSKKERK